jgi:hypothetical protein
MLNETIQKSWPEIIDETEGLGPSQGETRLANPLRSQREKWLELFSSD